ncbi:MAG TPA: hypothetical protein VLB46_14015 [Pyrinomonadaceae bacterium]|nr:hypothetical protein [Pyrinomonadaceae bacterium]
MRSTPAAAGRAANGKVLPATSGCIVTRVSAETLAARRPPPKRGFSRVCSFIM